MYVHAYAFIFVHVYIIDRYIDIVACVSRINFNRERERYKIKGRIFENPVRSSGFLDCRSFRIAEPRLSEEEG